jgi:hypothetical protein
MVLVAYDLDRHSPFNEFVQNSAELSSQRSFGRGPEAMETMWIYAGPSRTGFCGPLQRTTRTSRSAPSIFANHAANLLAGAYK